MRTSHHRPRIRRRVSAQQCGFTLVELVVSMTVAAILMTGIASAVFIAGHALPQRNTSTEAVLEATDVAKQMASELKCAITFTVRSATAVEFTVPDRDADLAAETIRYAWSGTPGDPLTRKYNGGTVVNVVDDVQEFTLDYVLKTVTEQPDPVSSEGAEVLLSSQDPPTTPADFVITETQWIGQYFFPSLPADATAWKVTRVKFMARAHAPAKGITAVQLRLPTGTYLPDTTVLEEVLMVESDLAKSYLWEEFSFSSVSGLSPTRGLCLVLVLNTKDADLADTQYDSGAGSGRLTTGNAGSTWSRDAAQSMLYYVYGTVTAPMMPDPITRGWLRSVGISLRAGDDPSARVEAATQILNAPEVTGT